MNISRASISQIPITLMICILVILGGIVSALKLPIQMVPHIELPEIRVFAGRSGAAAEEIESVVIEPLETALKDVPGVEEVISEINAGQGNVRLVFSLDTNMDTALLNVMTALNQVPPMPRDISGPLIINSDSPRGGANSIATIQVRPIEAPAPDFNLSKYQDIVRDKVKYRLKSLDQIAFVEWQNYRKSEVVITFDPHRAAARGITLQTLRNHLASAIDKSGGYSEVNEIRYTVQTKGQFSVDSLSQLVIANREGIPIRLGDVATVEKTLRENRFYTMRNGLPSFYISLVAKKGTNTVEALDAINEELAQINQDVLSELGLVAEMSFDASVHIRNALALVKSNLGLGMLLALAILFYFLRGWRAIFTITLTVPVALAASIIMLQLLGRSLNVISMAGMAFSVGLIMDAAIIVQEAIMRHMSQGGDKQHAILSACNKVSGALISSTLTSVVIFVPILFIKGVEGQLFSDLAITMSVSVVASLLAALTIVPIVNSISKTTTLNEDRFQPTWKKIAYFLTRLNATKYHAFGWAIGGVLGVTFLVMELFPPLDFMPKAPTSGFFYVLMLDPGATKHQKQVELPKLIKEKLSPFLNTEHENAIENYNFFVTHSGIGGGFMYAKHSDRVEETMATIQQEVLKTLPVAQFYMIRGSMINVMGGQEAPNIALNLQGDNLPEMIRIAKKIQQSFRETHPDIPVRAMPMLEKTEPTIKVIPDDNSLSTSGMSRAQLADIVDSYTDGMFAGEYFDGNERLRLIVRSEPWQDVNTFSMLPVVTPDGRVHPLNNLATISLDDGPAKLRRVDGWKTVTLSFMPPTEMPMGELLALLNATVIPAIENELPPGVRVTVSGNADKMSTAIETVAQNFVIALFILFMLMATYFKSVTDSLAVLCIVPVSILGGICSLLLMNVFVNQSLDLLTLIGFVILLGLVVNNAILLVGETRHQQSLGLDIQQASQNALEIRFRAILMSSLTSIFGMLPLALIPGTGTEIYRGLAGVIAGGMLLSSVMVTLILPAILKLVPSPTLYKRGNNEITNDTALLDAQPSN